MGGEEQGHVLVVDADDQFVRRMTHALRRLGLQTIGAPDPAGAVEVLGAFPWSLVLVGDPGGDVSGEVFLCTLRRVVPRLRVALVVEAPSRLIDDRIREVGGLGAISRMAGPGVLARLVGEAQGNEDEPSVVSLNAADASELSGRLSGIHPAAIAASRAAVEGFREAVRSGELGLPARASILQGLQSIAAGTEAGVDDIVALLESDPTVVTAVLHQANLAEGEFATSALSIREACLRLGNRSALRLAHRVALRSMLALHSSPWKDLGEAWWVCSDAIAELARELAPKIGASAQDGFLAGLLANVGELAILAAAETWDDGDSSSAILVAVRELLPREHGRVGESVLTSWGYPQRWTRLARDHHGGVGIRPTPLQSIATLSWALVLDSGLSYIAPGEPADVGLLCTWLRIDPAEARALGAEVVGRLTS